jgi:uncharacterized protein (DUF1499 family)
MRANKQDWTFAGEEQVVEGIWLRRISALILLLLIIDLLVIISAPLARMHLGIEPMMAFAMFGPGIIASVLLSVLGVIIAIIAAFKRNSQVLKRAVMIFIIGVIPAISIIILVGPGKLASPPIHDISTDTIDPPQFQVAKSLRTDDENSLDYGGEELAAQQQAAYPDVKPVMIDLSVEQALTKASDIVFQLNWTLTSMDNDTGIIEAYDTTEVFGFIDDIAIRVRREGNGSRVDIRSVSRLGVSDLGKNAERIERFISLYNL